jgi:hypothetical protein
LRRLSGFTQPMLWQPGNRDVPNEAYLDHESASLAINELRALAKKPEPFFLALGFFKPHTPYKIPKRYWNLDRREDIPVIEPAAGQRTRRTSPFTRTTKS